MITGYSASAVYWTDDGRMHYGTN